MAATVRLVGRIASYCTVRPTAC